MEQVLPLIKTSSFEFILDHLYNVLVAEEANQRQQAINEGLDPNDYSFNVRKEEFDPVQVKDITTTPTVNVWYTESVYEKIQHNTQRNTAKYFLDIYVASDSEFEVQGVTKASKVCDRVVRQLFYILMSPKYIINLGLPMRIDDQAVNFIEKTQFLTCNKNVEIDKNVSSNNVIVTNMVYEVTMAEELADLEGDTIEAIIKVLDVQN